MHEVIYVITKQMFAIKRQIRHNELKFSFRIVFYWPSFNIFFYYCNAKNTYYFIINLTILIFFIQILVNFLETDSTKKNFFFFDSSIKP